MSTLDSRGAFDLAAVWKRTGGDSSKLTPAEVQLALHAELAGGIGKELPFELAYDRERCLDSPAHLATSVVDPFYAKHFERVHYECLDEVMKPYVLGETLKLGGSTYDPKQYLGLLILFSRTTFKSTMMMLILLWYYLDSKIRLKEDARAMYTHQVIEKAIEKGETVRNIARYNKKFRERFPEFKGPADEHWDKQTKWRWPNFNTYTAAEFSFMAYGESSDKTGGHYTLRLTDDWDTEESVTTDLMMDKSYSRFRMMNNLETLTREHNPHIVSGTHYHFQGTYKKLIKDGGYLVWEIPAHTGSPKRIFDLCALDGRTEKGRREIEAGLRWLEKDPPGKLNFPGLLPWRVLYKKALAQGPFIYATQQLLNPVPEGDQRFDHQALDEARVDDIPTPAEMWLYIRIDPAISVKKKNDETAILLGGVDWRGWRWQIDGWAGREKRPSEIARKAFALGRKWQHRGYRLQNIGVEAVQYQEALAQIMRDGVPEREATHHGESVPIVKSPCPVRSIQRSPDMRKQERILEMEGPVTRRELKVWRDNPVGEKLIGQYKNFPFDRDDLLDAAHDFWVGVLLPPRQMETEEPEMPPWLVKLLRDEASDPNAIRGTHNTVTLANWR